ncbi:MAG TPA: hypothetical protein PK854_12360 [Oscillospiraceae bacterium]|nr:hypothetical protein [Oscillospiraceae bacterium]HPS36043.1 hypothetical protein [Oscillospiraceae bacterium]
MLIPHLHFNSDCKQAIAIYETAFGTKAESVIYSHQYDPSQSVSDRIAHAVMKIHRQTVFLNDRFGNKNRTTDCAVHLIVMFESKAALLTCYDILKADSITVDPMQEPAYSPLCVQFIDRFGVLWGFMAEENATT